MTEREFCIWLSGVFSLRQPGSFFVPASLDLIERRLRETLAPNVDAVPDPGPMLGRPDLKAYVEDRVHRGAD